MLTILERFYELKKEIKITLFRLDFSNEELKKIQNMCKALAPYKVAVDTLSGEDIVLLLSEEAIAFGLKKLGGQKSEINKDLKERF